MGQWVTLESLEVIIGKCRLTLGHFISQLGLVKVTLWLL